MIMAIKNFENKKEEIIEKKINYIFEDEWFNSSEICLRWWKVTEIWCSKNKFKSKYRIILNDRNNRNRQLIEGVYSQDNPVYTDWNTGKPVYIVWDFKSDKPRKIYIKKGFKELVKFCWNLINKYEKEQKRNISPNVINVINTVNMRVWEQLSLFKIF
jgi:hypothetical protein